MRQDLIDVLKKITPEEQELLNGNRTIRKERYTNYGDFVVDSRLLLEKGRLIEIRPHTRFAYFPKHRHNYVEMVFMCAGSTTHIINGSTELVLNEGDLLFLNQNVYHEILPAGEGDIAVNFIILPEFFDRPISMIERENILRDFLISTLAGDAAMNDYLYIRTKGIVPVENLLENMIWTLIGRHSMMDTINQTSMGLLLMNLSRFADQIGRGDPQHEEQNLMFSVLDYIEHHYQDGTLAEISALSHLPAYQISRMLKKRTGKNFKELLRLRKLQQAAYLLQNSTLSIDRIIEHIGYENSSYFYRMFREKYGCSPSGYRQNPEL
jgi:AraC-like DNA-binding protein